MATYHHNNDHQYYTSVVEIKKQFRLKNPDAMQFQLMNYSNLVERIQHCVQCFTSVTDSSLIRANVCFKQPLSVACVRSLGGAFWKSEHFLFHLRTLVVEIRHIQLFKLFQKCRKFIIRVYTYR